MSDNQITEEQQSALSDLNDQPDLTEDVVENTLVYTKKEFDSVLNDISRQNPEFNLDQILQELAESQIQYLAETNYPNRPDYLTVDGVRNMTSPWLDDNIPRFNEIRLKRVKEALAEGPNVKPVLSYRDMISLIARNEENDVIKSPTNMEGFGRAVKEKGLGNLMASGGFWAGVKGANLALSGVPVTNPYTAIVRIGGPVVTGLTSMFLSKMLGDEVTDKALTITGFDTKAFIPGTSETGYYAGDLSTAFATFAPISAAIPKGIDLGSKAGIQIATDLGKKIPFSTRATAYLEKMLAETGQAFRKRPGAMATVEGVGGAASVTAGSAMYAIDPEADAARLLVELGAGVTGAGTTNLLVNKIFGETGRKYFGKAIKEAFTKSPVKNIKNLFGLVTSKAGDKTEDVVGRYILKVIEESGEDVEEIIKKLESDEFTKIVDDAGKTQSVAIVDEDGNPIEMTASMKAQSVAIAALERAVERSTAGLGKEREAANLQVKRTLRNTLTALYASGDKKASQEAAELMEVIFTNNMENDLKTTIKKLVDAFEKVRGGGKPITLTDGEIIDPETFMVTLSNRLNKFLNEKNEEFRTQGNRLWDALSNEVGDLRLSNFKYSDDTTGNTPNFITEWRERVPSVPEGTKDYEQVREGSLNFPGLTTLEKFVSRIERQLADAADPKKDAIFTGIPFKELNSMRGIALGIARQARSGPNPNPDAASIANVFVSAIIKDLGSLDETDLFNLASSRSIRYAYDAARAHTKARKEAFNQTFLRKAFQKEVPGQLTMEPEMLINQFLKGDQAFIKTAQLDAIGKFELNQNLAIDLEQSLKGRGQEVLDDVLNKTVNKESGFFELGLLQTYLTNNSKKLKEFPQALNAIQQALNSSTTSRGIIDLGLRRLKSEAFPDKKALAVWLDEVVTNPVKSMATLDSWMSKEVNQNLLKMFPELKNDLQDLQIARALLDDKSAINIRKAKELSQELSFKSLLFNVTENPKTAIDKALRYNNPLKLKDLNNLFKAVKEAPEKWTVRKIGDDGKEYLKTFYKQDAIEGFRTAIFDSIFEKKGQTISTFDPADVYQSFFKELPNTDKLKLSDWMISNGLLSEAQSTNIQKLLNNMMEAQLFATTGGSADDLDGLATRIGPAIDLYLRVAGSQAGANLQRLLPGESGAATLVAAGAGSKAFRSVWQKVFANIPDSLKQDYMVKLFKDPKKLATLLKAAKSNTAQKNKNLAIRFLNSMVKDGLAVPRRQIPLLIDAGEDRSDNFGEAVDYILERITPWDEETDAEKIKRERLERESNIRKKNREIERRVREQRERRNNELRISFLQRQSDGFPPTTNLTSPASGPGQVDRARFAALFPEDRDLIGIESLMT